MRQNGALSPCFDFGGYGLGACGHFVDSVDTLNPQYQLRICGTGVDESYQDREYNHINDLQHIGHRDIVGLVASLYPV